MHSWDIQFYKNSRGEECAKVFIRDQDASSKAKIAKAINLLSDYGPDLGMPLSKNLKNGLYELRILGKNSIRIFYIFQIEKTIFMLHGFKKKTQKTPVRELDIARKRQKELINI